MPSRRCLRLAADRSLCQVQDLRQLIIDARPHAASLVNSTLTLLYWRVSDRIRRECSTKWARLVRATNSCHAVARIDRGVWPPLRRDQTYAHDEVCGVISGREDCCDILSALSLAWFADKTIREPARIPKELRGHNSSARHLSRRSRPPVSRTSRKPS
jgi:hypothetical protein